MKRIVVLRCEYDPAVAGARAAAEAEVLLAIAGRAVILHPMSSEPQPETVSSCHTWRTEQGVRVIEQWDVHGGAVSGCCEIACEGGMDDDDRPP